VPQLPGQDRVDAVITDGFHPRPEDQSRHAGTQTLLALHATFPAFREFSAHLSLSARESFLCVSQLRLQPACPRLHEQAARASARKRPGRQKPLRSRRRISGRKVPLRAQ
jgi:hypothetical protein